ncbi:hypothetical protein ACHAXR_007337 [Thalassiosira sp. AJA248-18]
MKAISRCTIGGQDSDAHKFDQFLKKLETTKQGAENKTVTSSSSFMNNETSMSSVLLRVNRVDSSDGNSTFDSRNECAFHEMSDTATEFDDHEGGGSHRRSPSTNSNSNNERQLFETRQSFVDRRATDGSGPTTFHDSVDSFIERAQSGQGSPKASQNCTAATGEEQQKLFNRESDTTRFFDEGLPDAILKLDRRHAIPTPRHKNDVLVEIEASTVDRREFMTRPGVRCTESLPQGVETTGMDCIGRVVQLTTHARAIYGISIDDRVAAIYPFEYKDEYKDKGRRNNRYALVDAGLVVTVPKHVDAAEAACMIRLYLSAFQSIQMGIPSLHDRYDLSQLKGQSILIQNGQTELGRALIDQGRLLGASQIFATGPTECHPLLMELGAIPLGAETFGWELFIEEKISLVLVQEMPNPENFEQFISILDDNKGNMVYIHHGNKSDDDNEFALAEDITKGCDGAHLQDLARKAAFSLRLACSPKYLVYEGVWASCKENKSQFKEDLRYLLTLLGRGNLKPNVNECIGLEDVAGVQDRIELLGKKGTIVCLPTALYEKKVYVVNPNNSPSRDQQGFPVVEGSDFNAFSSPSDKDPVHTYACDAGYVKAATQPYDTLSDFHYMHDKKKLASISDNASSLPALPEASSYSQSNLNHQSNNFGAQHNSSLMGSMNHTRRSSDGFLQNYYYHHYDTSSLVSSPTSSTANVSTGQTALSEGALKATTPFLEEEDPPLSIQFRNKKYRRYHAFQRHKRNESWKKSHPQQKKKNEGNNNDGQQDQEVDSQSSREKYVSSPPSSSYSARRMRREARMREQKSAGAVNVAEENPVAKDKDATEPMSVRVATVPTREQTSAAAAGAEEEKSITTTDNVDTTDTQQLPKMEQASASPPVSEAVEKTETTQNNVDATKASVRNEAMVVPKRERIIAPVGVVEEELVASNISPMKPVQSSKASVRKISRHHGAVRRVAQSYRFDDDAQIKPDNNNNKLQDSRNEDECTARDDSLNSHEFNSLMSKWKLIDGMSP